MHTLKKSGVHGRWMAVPRFLRVEIDFLDVEDMSERGQGAGGCRPNIFQQRGLVYKFYDFGGK